MAAYNSIGQEAMKRIIRIRQYNKQGNAGNEENKLSKKEWKHKREGDKRQTHKKELKEAISKKCW